MRAPQRTALLQQYTCASPSPVRLNIVRFTLTGMLGHIQRCVSMLRSCQGRSANSQGDLCVPRAFMLRVMFRSCRGAVGHGNHQRELMVFLRAICLAMPAGLVPGVDLELGKDAVFVKLGARLPMDE